VQATDATRHARNNRAGKPTDNCCVETFNESFRDECLNVHWFETIDERKRRSKLGALSTT
jgi:hypothetical protein